MRPGHALLRGRMGGGGGSAQYWNPSDKHASITLSGSNKIAAFSDSAGFRSVKSVTSHTTGKRYAEILRTSGSTSWAMMLGVGTASSPLGNYVGSDTNGWGLQVDGGGAGLLRNGSYVGSAITAISVGEHCRVAIDFDAGKGWIGNPTQWHGGGDPATDTTPSFTFTPGTAMFVIASAQFTTSEAATLRTASADFSGSVPGGFAAWG